MMMSSILRQIRALEMAKKFPHCEVIGVDLAPVPVEPGNLPPNCRFEIDDVNLGLKQFHNSVDFIQLRSVAAGVRFFRSVFGYSWLTDDGRFMILGKRWKRLRGA